MSSSSEDSPPSTSTSTATLEPTNSTAEELTKADRADWTFGGRFRVIHNETFAGNNRRRVVECVRCGRRVAAYANHHLRQHLEYVHKEVLPGTGKRMPKQWKRNAHTDWTLGGQFRVIQAAEKTTESGFVYLLRTVLCVYCKTTLKSANLRRLRQHTTTTEHLEAKLNSESSANSSKKNSTPKTAKVQKKSKHPAVPENAEIAPALETERTLRPRRAQKSSDIRKFMLGSASESPAASSNPNPIFEPETEPIIDPGSEPELPTDDETESAYTLSGESSAEDSDEEAEESEEAASTERKYESEIDEEPENTTENEPDYESENETGEIAKEPTDLPDFIPLDVFKFLKYRVRKEPTLHGTQGSNSNIIRIPQLECRICQFRCLGTKSSISSHLRSVEHRRGPACNQSPERPIEAIEVTDFSTLPEWLSPDVFKVTIEGVYLAQGYPQPRRMALCKFCDKKMVAVTRQSVAVHLASKSHVQKMEEKSNDPNWLATLPEPSVIDLKKWLKRPPWLPADEFQMTFEGFFDRLGERFPQRFAECIICCKKMSVIYPSAIRRHRRSAKHRSCVRAAEWGRRSNAVANNRPPKASRSSNRNPDASTITGRVESSNRSPKAPGIPSTTESSTGDLPNFPESNPIEDNVEIQIVEMANSAPLTPIAELEQICSIFPNNPNRRGQPSERSRKWAALTEQVNLPNSDENTAKRSRADPGITQMQTPTAASRNTEVQNSNQPDIQYTGSVASTMRHSSLPKGSSAGDAAVIRPQGVQPAGQSPQNEAQKRTTKPLTRNGLQNPLQWPQPNQQICGICPPGLCVHIFGNPQNLQMAEFMMTMANMSSAMPFAAHPNRFPQPSANGFFPNVYPQFGFGGFQPPAYNFIFNQPPTTQPCNPHPNPQKPPKPEIIELSDDDEPTEIAGPMTRAMRRKAESNSQSRGEAAQLAEQSQPLDGRIRRRVFIESDDEDAEETLQNIANSSEATEPNKAVEAGNFSNQNLSVESLDNGPETEAECSQMRTNDNDSQILAPMDNSMVRAYPLPEDSTDNNPPTEPENKVGNEETNETEEENTAEPSTSVETPIPAAAVFSGSTPGKIEIKEENESIDGVFEAEEPEAGVGAEESEPEEETPSNQRAPPQPAQGRSQNPTDSPSKSAATERRIDFIDWSKSKNPPKGFQRPNR